MPVKWEGDNDRKMLLWLLKRTETKDIDIDLLATFIEGATPKAIRERISRLRVEAKPMFGTGGEDETAAKPAYTGKPRGRPKKDAGGKGGGKGMKRKRTGGILAEERDGDGEGGSGGVEDDEEEEEGVDVKKVKIEQEGEEGGVGGGEFEG